LTEFRLLTTLVIHAGELLSVDRLVEELWGDLKQHRTRPPPSSAARITGELVRGLMAGRGREAWTAAFIERRAGSHTLLVTVLRTVAVACIEA
jgi:hypothetical protein